MTKRILFFADASSVHTQRWVQAMVARGFEAVVVTRRPARIPGVREVIPVREGDSGSGWFLGLPDVRRLAAQWAPQWVHGHYVTGYGLWAAACGSPAPLVLTAWGSDILVTPKAKGLRGSFMAGLVGWSLKRAQLLTADSQDVLDEMRRYGVTAPCQEVFWGADTERFRPAARPPGRGLRLVSLRQWEPNYNLDIVLRAFARLRAERPKADATLELLGGGPDEPILRALATELGLGESVRFTGRVDDAGLVAALQRAHLSVSVPSSDATSVSLLEAMACGLPVVVSDLPANRQWVDEAALRVPPRDAEALAAALLRLHDEPGLAKREGLRNRERVVAEASRKAQMDRMAVLYGSLQLKAPAPRQV